MRKIKSNFFISLDGVVESPDRWHFPYFDDEMGAAVGAGFSSADALLMGRVLYNEWAAYWPEHANEPFGDVMNSIKKYVGGDIAMSGSATTVRWLLREGLLDELNLLVHPIAVGDGLGSALSAGRAEHPPAATERTNLQDRRAEPQLRAGQGLTAGTGLRRA